MIWLIILIAMLVVATLLAIKFRDIKEWYQDRIDAKYYTWFLAHQNELPIPPKILNAGEWVKIEGDIVIPTDGIYVFLCRGDNHLFYEIHELCQGVPLLRDFQGENLHFDSWFSVKPLYYYYIPFNKML